MPDKDQSGDTPDKDKLSGVASRDVTDTYSHYPVWVEVRLGTRFDKVETAKPGYVDKSSFGISQAVEFFFTQFIDDTDILMESIARGALPPRHEIVTTVDEDDHAIAILTYRFEIPRG